MHLHFVKDKEQKEWLIPYPPKNNFTLVMPTSRFSTLSFLKVEMDGVRAIDRGGTYRGIYTYDLHGCLCTCLIRMRKGVICRIAMNHKSFIDRWRELVGLYNGKVGSGAPQPGDETYMIQAEDGVGLVDAYDDVKKAGLTVPDANRFTYARSLNQEHAAITGTDRVSFGVMWEGYAGEIPTDQRKGLPPIGQSGAKPLGS
jgi:hypothetical protein